MNFTFACSHCGEPLAATPGQTGFQVTCPNCKASVVVPPASQGTPSGTSGPPEVQKSFLKSAMVLGLGALSAVYLVNPTAGILELIPDNIPFLGNLDEAGATLLILNCLAYFGVDLTNLIKSMKKKPGEVDEGETKIQGRG